MIDQICAHIHNYFTDPEDIRAGDYAISGGAIDLPFLMNGQYFRIVGSTLNDGVYQYPAEGLLDERFTGEIWPMKVPRDLRALAVEIALWKEKYGAAAASPYQSESFDGYSYTKASAGNGQTGGADAWMSIFAPRLNAWRKLR